MGVRHEEAVVKYRAEEDQHWRRLERYRRELVTLNERLLTEPEAAELMGVSCRSLRRWRAGRKIRCLVLGGKTVRYRRKDVEEFLRACEQAVRPGRKRA